MLPACDKHEQNPNKETGRVRQLAWAQEQVLAPGEVTEKRATILKEWKKKWTARESEGRSNVPKTSEVGVQNLAVQMVRDDQEDPEREETN